MLVERKYLPGGIRTPDTRLRRPLLYPTELLGEVVAATSILTPTEIDYSGNKPMNQACIQTKIKCKDPIMIDLQFPDFAHRML